MRFGHIVAATAGLSAAPSIGFAATAQSANADHTTACHSYAYNSGWASNCTIGDGYYTTSGNYILAIQQMLQAEGYGTTLDGIWGSQTKSAIKAYQTDHGLTSDGIVGSATWGNLRSHNAQSNGVFDNGAGYYGYNYRLFAGCAGDTWYTYWYQHPILNRLWDIRHYNAFYTLQLSGNITPPFRDDTNCP
jgi:peptidoglycan hydrolase-like protein with peptidoglycan-binding domain